MVRVWGRWCGPNWTAGRAIPARDYDWDSDPSPGTTDNLDLCCRIHDRTYGTSESHEAREVADRRLEKCAALVATEDPLSRKGIAALLIVSAMKAKEQWE